MDTSDALIILEDCMFRLALPRLTGHHA